MTKETQQEIKHEALAIAPPGTTIAVPEGAAVGGSILGVVLFAIGTVLTLRKKLSKDNLEITKDRAETDLIKTYQDTIRTLQEQNAKLDINARDAWRTRAEDAKRIGELTSKVEHLSEVNASMEKTIEQLRGEVSAAHQTTNELREEIRTLHQTIKDMAQQQQQQTILQPVPEADNASA